jgi:hypothetical protein
MVSKWAAVAVVVLTTGCDSHGDSAGHNRAVLYRGAELSHGDGSVTTHRFSDPAARRAGARIRGQWEQEVRHRAIEAPRQHFANLPPDTLKERLTKAAAKHDFQVVALTLWLPRPRQFAPEIVIRTTRYLALARALPGILARIDPHTGKTDTRGWSYEGFFLEARDERGVPFLGVYNFLRGQHKGGGQWARSEALFPFPHG